MDVEGRRSFIERIAEFARMGKTVVLTTHTGGSRSAAKRVIVIDRGVVIADAPPADIKSKSGQACAFSRTDPRQKISRTSRDGCHDQRITGQLLTKQPESVLRDALFQRE